MTGPSVRAAAYGFATALLALGSFLFGLAMAAALFGPQMSFGAAVVIAQPIGCVYFWAMRRLGAWAVAR